MNVNGIGAGMSAGHAGKALGRAKQVEAPSSATKTDSPSQVKVEDVGGEVSEAKTKGVVRLLQEGHFKGVADVRLRINFHDELTQLSIQSVQVDFGDQVEQFEQGVDEAFATLLSAVEATEEQAVAATDLFDGFKASIAELTSGFVEGGGTDFSSVATQLGSAFDAFVLELEALFAPDPAVEPEEGVLPVEGDVVALSEVVTTGDIPEGVDGVEVVLSPFEAFRAELGAALGELAEAVEQSAQTLPELSDPQGNGAAYAKFLEMLEALMGGSGESGPESAMPDILI